MTFVIALVLGAFLFGLLFGWAMAPFIDMFMDEDNRYDYLNDEPKWRDD